jgi:hypothetical protein
MLILLALPEICALAQIPPLPFVGGLPQLIHHLPWHHPPRSLGMVPPPVLPLIVRTSQRLVLWRKQHSSQ